MSQSTGFNYSSEKPGYAQDYLRPEIIRLLGPEKQKVLDIGCGNGAMAKVLLAQGHEVWGCDWDQAGVELASRIRPGRFVQWDLNRPVQEFPFRDFQAVISTEVIEHLFYPRTLLALARHVLPSEGRLILTTPYHGYLKNLVLSLLNKWDWHHHVDHDGEHIKFFSPKTLGKLMTHEGFVLEGWKGCGRCPGLWKSMVMWGRKVDQSDKRN
jgi:2-polyprenyl-3-methyl-5-hydroxy-6-metoxy-1,4-benzoquinol methylase